MTDHLELRLFPRDGADILSTLDRPVYGLVGVHTGSPEMTLEDELTILRDLHNDTKPLFDRWIVYGTLPSGEDRGLLLCNADSPDVLHPFLNTQARRYNQRGFCYGIRGWQNQFVVPDQDVMAGTPLSPYDGSAAVLNGWAGHIHAGFDFKGYFPRDVLYVQRKLREHGVQ